MLVQGSTMEDSAKMESHLSSAAAFVEGGIQDACDDACSICLEVFCESDPSTLPVGGSDAELEERIIQHLAAAAAMGRAHHLGRREGRGRSGSHSHPQYLVFSTNSNTPSVGSLSASSATRVENELAPETVGANPSASVTTPVGESAEVTSVTPTHANHIALLTSGTSSDRCRYKESIVKSTRGWRERLFSRNSSVADIGSEVRKEVNAGIATVSRIMERLDTRDSRRTSSSSASPSAEVHSVMELRNEGVISNHASTHPNNSTTTSSCIATSGLD
ncbi:hypothetical protein BHE74_00029418 [Ensete ventricosum]|nr:hypothetical protein GW17_00026460 [Ensete ventricosum]RWW63401.1 hypothetical protein BHE74_00029418 [Ensete ventricosum]RZR91009.1 hypothetical protein BHM03_00019043 [Ensete ventricosum]